MGTLLKEKTIVAFSENNSHADGAQLPNGDIARKAVTPADSVCDLR